jgi:hypothetical protein
MPLTMLLGTAVFFGLLPGEGIAFAALLGIILAPTDAALGLPIFNDPKVPVRIRRALNVESGLNDGIATPFVLLFLSLQPPVKLRLGGLAGKALLEIMFALLVGVGGDWGGWLLSKAADRGWSSGISQQLAIFGLAWRPLRIIDDRRQRFYRRFPAESSARQRPFLRPAVTEYRHINFAAGGLSSAVLPFEGAVLCQRWRPFACAVLSLTAVRMLPVALTMRRAGLRLTRCPDGLVRPARPGFGGFPAAVMTLRKPADPPICSSQRPPGQYC